MLTGRDSIKLLVSSVSSNLELIRLSGDSFRASFMSRPYLQGLDGCSLNILSLPLFLFLLRLVSAVAIFLLNLLLHFGHLVDSYFVGILCHLLLLMAVDAVFPSRHKHVPHSCFDTSALLFFGLASCLFWHRLICLIDDSVRLQPDVLNGVFSFSLSYFTLD